MTTNDQGVTQPPRWVQWARTKLDPYFPPQRRDVLARVISAVTTALMGAGVLTADKAALWSQFGVGLVTLLFATLYAASQVWASAYGILVVGSALLGAYGIAHGIDWAIVLGAAAQAFGITTAAARAQPPAA